ncbi:MAG: methylenetetrahydrofolate reductase, partial [Solirubrobacteraceae bacterium]
LQADLLGAWALGVRSILALSGDPLKVGPYEELASARGDLDSIGLIALVAGMNAGRLAAGEELAQPTDFLIATAANPLVDTRERLESKLDAGAHCFQTNIVYDVDRFAEWYAGIVDAGIPERAPVLVGVTPPRSTRMLRYMHEKIPGVEVDDATFARLEGLEGEDAKRAGIEVAVDVVRRLRALPHVAGVHLMAPGWEAEAVPAVVAGAGLERA